MSTSGPLPATRPRDAPRRLTAVTEGRTPLLFAIAAMNAVTGIGIALVLAPASAGRDAATFRDGALEIAAHRDFAYGFLYPPLSAVLATPLTWVSPAAAAVVMTAIGVAVLAIGVALETRGLRTVDRWLVLVAALGFAPVVNELLLGQVTLLVAAAVLALRDRDGLVRGVPLGLVLALAPKPLLIPLLVWCLAFRRRGLLAALAVAGVVTLAGIVIVGVEPYRAWLDVLVGAGSVERRGNLALSQLDSLPVIVTLAGATVVAVVVAARADERRGFVASLLAGLVLAPYTLLYSASILLVAVRPALRFAPRATAALAFVANIAMIVAFLAWSALGLIACLRVRWTRLASGRAGG
jgi:hypothetical protein